MLACTQANAVRFSCSFFGVHSLCCGNGVSAYEATGKKGLKSSAAPLKPQCTALPLSPSIVVCPVAFDCGRLLLRNLLLL